MASPAAEQEQVLQLAQTAAEAIRLDEAETRACLKMARQLGIWFYRTFEDQRFKAGPFQPPRPPIDATAEVTAELGRLRAERDAALSEAQRAKAAAEDAEAARLAAETGARRLQALIDEKLRERGWEADTQKLRSVGAPRRMDAISV